MSKRPVSVTIISWLFIAVGLVGLTYHASEFKAGFRYDTLWVCLVRLAAVICGVFMLRGSNWARWGLLAWMAFHIVLSAFHSFSQFITHVVLFSVIGYLLLRPSVSAYFRTGRADPAVVRGT